jgi:hypothetical protein
MVAHRTIGPRAAIWSADDRMRRPGYAKASAITTPVSTPTAIAIVLVLAQSAARRIRSLRKFKLDSP